MRGFGFPEPAHKAESIYHTTERLHILVGNKGEKEYSYHINHKINKKPEQEMFAGADPTHTAQLHLEDEGGPSPS